MTTYAGCPNGPYISHWSQAMVPLWDVPLWYTWIAEPGVTLTMLGASQPYVGKVVLLGGTILEEEETNSQMLMLRLKNRPLTRITSLTVRRLGSPEAGSYWVMVSKKQVPPKFRN